MNGRVTWGAILVVVSSLTLANNGVSAADERGTRLLSQPAVSESHVAFVYDGDLWIANRDGTSPRRLTSHEGQESSPRFSPDGQSIAFSAQYDGNTDVYVMPIRGGAPKRLTYHPADDRVCGFHPDGSSVLFSSSRNVFTGRYRKLLTVAVDGGFPTELPIPNGLRASYSPDGSKIAYIPIGERFNQWKNYRGGTHSRIWIFDVDDYSVQQIRQPDGRCNDTDPVFIGDTVYFRSDRNGEFNLFSFNPSTGAVEQLTEYDDFPVVRVTGSSDTLIYEQAGYLYLFDPVANRSTPIVVVVQTDMIETRPRYVSGSQWIRDASVSPSGARAVFEVRGDIVTVPAKKGDIRNLTKTPGVHERSPIWSPDGNSIAYFSDADGEYKLHIAPQDGKGETKIYSLEGNGFFENPRWSPDGTKISYIDNSWTLYVFDIAKDQVTKIASEPQFGPANVRALQHSWSADSNWIAYTLNTRALISQAFVYDVQNDKSRQITDGMSEVSNPVFDKSGKYLYFISSTDAGPVKHWFAMSNADMESTNQVYVAVLQEDGDNPLSREQDEEKTSSDEKKAKDSDDKQEDSEQTDDKNAQVKIDFDGLDQRILALPLAPAVYSSLQAGTPGNLYMIRTHRDGKSALISYSMDKREETTLLDGVTSFVLTPDAKKLLYAIGNQIGIAPVGKIAKGTGILATNNIEIRIDPRAEWQQIFDEVWRINRDYFYDPNMHGADWEAMKDKYQPLVADCVTRSDLNRVLMWMCSELAVGHHRVGGGDNRQTPQTVGVGLLGADFEIDGGRYRFKKVFGGLNWNGSMRAPLTEPGVRVKSGEYLLKVNGVDVTAADNVYRHFEKTSGKSVELTVGPNPDGSDSRTVSVVPVSSESAIRNRDWVEGNLRKVTEATDGRVAYVYVPNTTNQGHVYFKRYFFPQTDREAIIIDERFNGGGQVADYYIDLLRRPYISHWATRYGDDFSTPTGAIYGPKVMLIDETAGSGGDLLPFMFRKLHLGTLVGKRTWGGLVGTLGFPVLIDGGVVTAPNLAIWTEDGFVVENVGVPPDVEVEQWPAEVIAGRDPQLEKAIEIALQQLERNPPKKFNKPDYPIRVRSTAK